MLSMYTTRSLLSSCVLQHTTNQQQKKTAHKPVKNRFYECAVCFCLFLCIFQKEDRQSGVCNWRTRQKFAMKKQNLMLNSLPLLTRIHVLRLKRNFNSFIWQKDLQFFVVKSLNASIALLWFPQVLFCYTRTIRRLLFCIFISSSETDFWPFFVLFLWIFQRCFLNFFVDIFNENLGFS